MIMVSKTCKICDNAQSKYKCPNCLIPYCSLPCFKKHKEVPCAKPELSPQQQLPAASPPKELEKVCCLGEGNDVLQQVQLKSIAAAAPPPSKELEKVCYIDEESDVLEKVQLESIASSTEIREALNNEELRKLICNIDQSADAEMELDKAMEVEAFSIFSEKVLSTISSSYVGYPNNLG